MLSSTLDPAGRNRVKVAVIVMLSSCFTSGHDGARFTLVNPSQTPADNNWALQLWSVDAQGRELLHFGGQAWSSFEQQESSCVKVERARWRIGETPYTPSR